MKVKGLSKVPQKVKEKQSKKETNKAPKERNGIFKKLGKLKKRKVVVIVILAVVILLTVVAVVLYLKTSRNGKRQDFSFGNMQGNGNQFMVTEAMVAASGVTSVGVTEESFDVENLTTSLEIEEVYITSEDVITQGAKVLKLSEDSIAEAREELEQTLKDADLAYRAGVIEYEQSKITAEYDRDSTLLSGEQAKAVYDETMSSLKDSVERAQEELTQAKEDIAEYQSYVNNDSYKSYFKVDEYQAIYDKTLEALMDKMDEWGVSWSQVTGQGGGTTMGNANPGGTVSSGTVSGGDAVQNTGPTSDQIQVLASLYDVLEGQRKDLDQAQSDYENALANASFELQTLELKLPDLENTLAEAEKNYQNQVLQAELTYETSLANAQNAESDYETAMQQAENNYESLKKDWEDAKENLELFENSVGDGYFYASGSGTILRTMVRAGQNLTSEGTIFMYSNPEEMTVTVSVDQTNISSISLNNSVYIQSSEYGGFEGIVTEINPVSNSDSRTNVTYSVTVKFNGDTTNVPANESVTVIFGIDEEAIQNMITMSEENMQGGTLEGEQKPEDGQMPEGGQAPQNGEKELREDAEAPEGGQSPQNGEAPAGGNDQAQPAEGMQMPEGGAPEKGNTGNQ